MVRHLAAGLLTIGLALAFAALVLGYQPDAELNRTALYYAENTAKDLGSQNIVTAIVVTYRGLDTLGEVTVLFLAAAIVGLILAPGRGAEGAGRRGAPPPGELLTTGSRMLTPLILITGIYVFVNGHLTPGGGFQGGAILASAALLVLLADPGHRFAHRTIETIEGVSGVAYVAVGLLGLAFAGGFLDNRFLPTGRFGALLSAGAIPVIYTLIGLKVGAEFASILANLTETEERR
ncbi:MAG: sodium:proton antiporter [Hyphomicrobiales bacterium]|nr:sodium:proton antiporter [Hyphomicrobiales bacterium]